MTTDFKIQNRKLRIVKPMLKENQVEASAFKIHYKAIVDRMVLV